MSSFFDRIMDSADEENKAWFAIQTRMNRSKQVSEMLRLKGIESLFPVYQVKRRWCDRVHEAESPLFPGYVFARFDPLIRMPILTTAGVQRIVGFGQGPTAIPSEEIESIRKVVEEGVDVQVCSYLALGQRVRVNKGPLRGVAGILVQKKKFCRVVLSVSVIQRSVSVEVDAESLILDSPDETVTPEPVFI